VISVRFSAVEEIERLISDIPLDQREKLLANIIKSLPIESRSRVLGFVDGGGLAIITGSFVSLNSEIAVNIQNSNGGFDAEALVKALLDYRRSIC
jgi:hypothetical protein